MVHLCITTGNFITGKRANGYTQWHSRSLYYRVDIIAFAKLETFLKENLK